MSPFFLPGKSASLLVRAGLAVTNCPQGGGVGTIRAPGSTRFSPVMWGFARRHTTAARRQDTVEPMSFELVRAVIEQARGPVPRRKHPDGLESRGMLFENSGNPRDIHGVHATAPRSRMQKQP